MAHEPSERSEEDQPSTKRPHVRSPLATTTPPPLSLSTLRQLATKAETRISTTMLAAMRVQLEVLGAFDAIDELETLYDFETGRPRAVR